MKGDHLDRARDSANGGVPVHAIAHALIDIAESLRILARAGEPSSAVENMTITNGAL